MSETHQRNDDGQPEETDIDTETLQVELEVLRERNQRLRDSYARARRSTYRRTAIGFILVAAGSLAGAALFPALRTIFIAFAGAGAFAGIVTFYLTPERFVAASVGDAVFGVLSDVERQLVDELDLQSESVYVPTPTLAGQPVRLFVPQHVEYAVPNADSLRRLFVTSEIKSEQGVAFRPTGARLFDEFEQALGGSLGSDPTLVTRQLTDALVNQFELIDDFRIDVDEAGGRASVAITDPVYGDIERRDHPVTSLLAVGLATGLEQPVTAEVRDDDRLDAVVTLQWDSEMDDTGDTDDVEAESEQVET